MVNKNNLLFALVDALFSRPDTVQYPHSSLVLPEGFRGAIDFNPEYCIGCGLCVRDCPSNALELIRESREVYQLRYYPTRCAFCGQCQSTCSRGAIAHSNRIVPSTANADEIVEIFKDTSNGRLDQ
ncbi:MAG: 4Fe-4S binding protein [Anaerolineaceae bacterium]|jgi:formate hydrogenlyase subunit 6/NADH:ubiquinone oxidoreductase subunit I|nr:4Fe-4S binding protein [Anaerolineaceae bacterium]